MHNSTHIGRKDSVSVSKTTSARNDFLIDFGGFSHVFLSEDNLKKLKAQIERLLG